MKPDYLVLEHTEPSKIFFLGFNKTGTSSIAKSLINMGFNTCHGLEYVLSTHAKQKDLSFFNEYVGFTDGSGHDFMWLLETFPKAHFVLLTRNNYNWLLSKYNHARRDAAKSFTGKIVLSIFMTFPSIMRKKVESKVLYEKRVKHHFNCIGHLLTIVDVEANQQAAFDQIGGLLNLELEPVHINNAQNRDYQYMKSLKDLSDEAETNVDQLIVKSPSKLTYPRYSALSEWVFKKTTLMYRSVYIWSRHKRTSSFRRNIRNIISLFNGLILSLVDRKGRYCS